MISQLIRYAAAASTVGALSFGAIAALQQPAATQTISVKCWKEYCATDPDTGKETCVREQIDCPAQQ